MARVMRPTYRCHVNKAVVKKKKRKKKEASINKKKGLIVLKVFKLKTYIL